MTTLTRSPRREASLPWIGDGEYVVLGQPMEASVNHMLNVKLAFAESTFSTFWMAVVESNDLALEESHVDRVDQSLSSVDVMLALQYESVATRLTPTRLPDCDE